MLYMKRLHHLWTFILIGLACACNQPQDNSDNTTANVEKNDVNWSDSARNRYMKVAYYYNNNIHDSLVMAVPAERDFCKEHELWADYYDVWMMLGEEYNFSGEHSKAIDVAQEIHDDAAMRNNGYGLAAAEFIKALVYDSQLNHEESARSFEQALKIYPDSASSFLKNSIYVYYTYELRDLKDSEKMQRVLDEWKAYIDICRQDTTIPPRQFDNWLYYYHHSCYFYYLNQKDLDKAEQHVDSVVMHLDRQGWSQVTRNEVLGYRVQLAIARKNYSEALKLNDQQLPGAEELDINAYSEILKQRATILSNIGQWKEAYNYLTQHYELVDSINQAETRQQLNELNKRFEIDELRAQQEREKLQHEHEKIENERQRMYLLSIFGAFVVVGVIIVIILRQRAKRRLTALKAEQERMESELSIARDIQMSMVPSTFPQREGLDMYATMMPAREVGGDLYGYVIHDDLLYFCLGDVSGKGVPASLFMTTAINLFRVASHQQLSPAAIAKQMNETLNENNASCMFVTLFIGRADLLTGQVELCNCGHNPPVIISSGTPHFIELPFNCPLGIMSDIEFQSKSFDNIIGQSFFLYSDGLNEAENPLQEQFGDEHILHLLATHPFVSCQDTIELMKSEVARHTNGAEQSDDLTMLCLKIG